jgi:hypothetical protein
MTCFYLVTTVTQKSEVAVALKQAMAGRCFKTGHGSRCFKTGHGRPLLYFSED